MRNDEDIKRLPSAVIIRTIQKSVPWLWLIFIISLFLIFAALVLGDAFKPGWKYFGILGILGNLPILLILLKALFGPVRSHFKQLAEKLPSESDEAEDDEDEEPDKQAGIDINYILRRISWLYKLLIITVIGSAAAGIALLLGFDAPFISNILTILLLTAAAFTLMLKKPAIEPKQIPGTRKTRDGTKAIKIVVCAAAFLAVVGYVYLGWRVYLLFLTIIAGGSLYRVIQSFAEELLEKLLSLESQPAFPSQDQSFRGLMYRKQRRKTVRIFRFFLRNLFFVGGVYLLIVISGIPAKYISTIADYVFFSLGSLELSIESLLKAYFTMIIALMIGRIVKDILRYYLFPKAAMDVGTSQALSNVTFIFIISAGIITALSLMGVNLMGLSIVGGGLAVGIGFGLQNITNNIISGVILFFERPINVGDVIDVNGTLGTVRQIGIRSTVVTTFNNIAVIIPSSEFISGTVINWSWGDISMRLDVPVGVAYGTDVKLVKDLLIEIANSHDMVKDSPAPEVLFQEFADSSLNFSLRIWIKDLRKRPQILSDMNFKIDEAFNREKIEIPFPQQDIYIRQTGEQA